MYISQTSRPLMQRRSGSTDRHFKEAANTESQAETDIKFSNFPQKSLEVPHETESEPETSPRRRAQERYDSDMMHEKRVYHSLSLQRAQHLLNAATAKKQEQCQVTSETQAEPESQANFHDGALSPKRDSGAVQDIWRPWYRSSVARPEVHRESKPLYNLSMPSSDVNHLTSSTEALYESGSRPKGKARRIAAHPPQKSLGSVVLANAEASSDTKKATSGDRQDSTNDTHTLLPYNDVGLSVTEVTSSNISVIGSFESDTAFVSIDQRGGDSRDRSTSTSWIRRRMGSSLSAARSSRVHAEQSSNRSEAPRFRRLTSTAEQIDQLRRLWRRDNAPSTRDRLKRAVRSIRRLSYRLFRTSMINADDSEVLDRRAAPEPQDGMYSARFSVDSYYLPYVPLDLPGLDNPGSSTLAGPFELATLADESDDFYDASATRFDDRRSSSVISEPLSPMTMPRKPAELTALPIYAANRMCEPGHQQQTPRRSSSVHLRSTSRASFAEIQQRWLRPQADARANQIEGWVPPGI